MRFRKIATGKNAGNYRASIGVWTPDQVALYRATKGGAAKAPGRSVKVTRSSGAKKMKARRRAEAKR